MAGGIELDANTAEDLAEHGHTVHLYVPWPSRGISKELAKRVPKKEHLEDGKLQIYRYRMFPEGKSIKQRIARYCACSVMQLWYGLKLKKIDLIFAGSTPPFQGVICSLIKKIKKVPFVYNCQDIFPDSLVSTGMTNEGTVVWRVGCKIAEITYEAADKIIVISEEMRNTLIDKGVPKEKIEIVYNWVDEKVIHPIEKNNNQLIEDLDIPYYDFTVVYAGNLGYAQGIDVILEAAELLKGDERIGFIIFGNGAIENDVKRQIIERQLTNVHLYPLQPYNRVAEVYSIGDACVVSCKIGTGGFAVPSKTWSIMGCGKPVLASFDEGTLLERIIQGNDCGLFAKAGDAQKLSENIIALCNSPKRAKVQGENARAYIETYLSRKISTHKICTIMDTLDKQRSNHTV